MPDIGTLSYEYEQASGLAEKLGALINQSDVGHVDRELCLQVALALDGLVSLLDPLSEEAHDDDLTMRTPVGLARRLRRKDFEGHSYVDAVRGLRGQLRSARQPLTAGDLKLLRELRGATDHEVAVTFRRMVRR
jgi:hypothetical protein